MKCNKETKKFMNLQKQIVNYDQPSSFEHHKFMGGILASLFTFHSS